MPDGIPKQSGLGQWKKSNNDRSLGELQLQFPFFAYWFRVIVQTNQPTTSHQPPANCKDFCLYNNPKMQNKKKGSCNCNYPERLVFFTQSIPRSSDTGTTQEILRYPICFCNRNCKVNCFHRTIGRCPCNRRSVYRHR